ncbi:MAG: hypothetical protein K0R46_3101 [Herbinix sp.]|jgi:hypothetical protein|nr:hypothetical protein [Herbinix sp.]
MDTGIIKQKKSAVRFKTGSMPPILTLSIVTFIVSFILIARWLFNTYQEEVSIPVFSNHIVIMDEKELNVSELEVLSLLSSCSILPDYNSQVSSIDSIFYKTLHEYLSSSEVCLTSKQASQIVSNIIDLQEIMNYEGEAEFSKMSLEGKKVAIYLTEQIYELCNLKLQLNMEGNIEKISDRSDNIIYSNRAPTSQHGIQVNILIITLTSMAILLSICIAIAKKNQLFMKEVGYDGFDEERFA